MSVHVSPAVELHVSKSTFIHTPTNLTLLPCGPCCQVYIEAVRRAQAVQTEAEAYTGWVGGEGSVGFSV